MPSAALRLYETPLTAPVLARLLAMSADWAAENSCYGYRANTREDIDGNRVFLAEAEGSVVGYLFGHAAQAHNMTSIMPEGTPFFEIEELFVVPGMRSRGVGKALFDHACGAVEDACDFVLLSTAAKNWRAILHFYIDEAGMDFWSARLFKRLRAEETP